MNCICKICGTSSNHEKYSVKEMMYGTQEEFQYFQCSNCECLQIKDIPNDLQRYYPSQYYSFSELAVNSTSTLKDRLKRERLNYSLFKTGLIGKLLVSIFGEPSLPIWIRTAKIEPDHSILDVGCGSGELLVAMRCEGFTKLSGVDPFIDKKIDYKNGVTIHKKSISDLTDEYDAVMFHHSFEHMPDPLNILHSLQNILSNTGRVIIRVPVVSSFAWRHYKTHWVQIDAPRHLYLHSLESMALLAKKTGFIIDKIEYDSNINQFWGSEQIIKGISYMDERSYRINPEKSIFTAEEIMEFKIRTKVLNAHEDGDQAIFYMSKSVASG